MPNEHDGGNQVPGELAYIDYIIRSYETTILIIFSPVLIIIMKWAISLVRGKHPNHVHTLFYIFSIGFCAASLLYYRWHIIHISGRGEMPPDTIEIISRKILIFTTGISDEIYLRCST
jgi:hypothetical protein